MTDTLQDDGFGDFTPRRSSIGLTALIDVVFILLMFFMLTSSFVRWHAVDLAVPAAAAAATPVDAPPPLQLVLDADGGLTTTDGAARLGNYRTLRPGALNNFADGRAVVLRPRHEATLETIVGASEALLQAGGHDVALGPLAAPIATP
ncbi:MAG: biopolymer transporter ExbD [Gammaproteobacteria bacterium]|nr:biopolymer transporter ExbD [Gammaproteobacteria bacterium]